MKVSRLVALLIRRSPFRAMMLAALIAVCSVVFSLVSELSRVSTEGLDAAIFQDNGYLGTYSVSLAGVPLTIEDQFDVVDRAAESLDMSVWRYSEVLPEVESECPPFDQVGRRSLQVMWERPGVPAELDFGHIEGVNAEWCIDGQSIPKDALFAPSSDEEAIYGAQLYIDPAYANLVALSTTDPITYGFYVVSGREDDQVDALRFAVLDEVASLAEASGYAPSVVIGRVDSAEVNVRDAADGIALVYDLIRWGVLLLAGLALMTVQMLSARQRGWFQGLLIALGAGRARVVALVALDTAIVAVAGLVLAVITLGALSDPVASFAEQSLQVQARSLSATSLVPLGFGIASVAAIAAVGPALMVVRRDPLAVLEAPRD
ncbi:FtsX-like permease family protein [Demequina sp.]|uniref:FtsX-like permease family protein n=1 Tax=Demequina sp. TaxID=2050685 RepID=UPI003A87A131